MKTKTISDHADLQRRIESGRLTDRYMRGWLNDRLRLLLSRTRVRSFEEVDPYTTVFSQFLLIYREGEIVKVVFDFTSVSDCRVGAEIILSHGAAASLLDKFVENVFRHPHFATLLDRHKATGSAVN